ncbi:MAG: hypothetical protein ORN53_02890, partial [Crocinitomicaceae bacterium]|nr:hypothetical protein [Crocinitomicaceae bacterium]
RPSQSTYSVQPSELAGCTGTAQTYTITVNPTPVVAQPTSQTVCTGASFAATNFTSATTGTTYAWTSSNTAVGLAASGSGNIASFTATNTTNAPITTTVTVTPTYGSTGTVYGECNENGSITLNAPTGTVFTSVNFASYGTPTGTGGTYTIGACHSTTSSSVVSSLALGQTTVTIPANNATFGDPCGVAGKSLAVKLTYGPACSGTPKTFTLTVNPGPDMTDPTDQVVCAGTSTSVNFTSPLNVAGTVYTWSNDNTATGLAASGTGNIASFVSTNTTNAPIISTITVTPSFTNQGSTCTGPAQTFTITVNPIPNVTAPANQTLCVGTSTSVAFTSPLNVAGTVYTWVNDNAATGLGAGSTGNIGTFTTTNTTNAAITSSVTVTPTYTNQSVTCTGTPQTFTITVNPI